MRAVWQTAMLGLVLSMTGSSCLVQNISEEDIDANEVYQLTGGSASTASNCVQNTFRLTMHPIMVNNCASCHSDEHGSTNPNISYTQSRQRSNFNNPSSSILVTYAGTAGHCGQCGSGLAQSVSNAITIWGRAERGDTATCAEYEQVSNIPGNTKPFDLGAYTPPNPNNTVIVQDGLNEFRTAGGVHEILRANCAQCHIPGGLSSLAPFAVTDATASYRQSKPRMNFNNIDASLMLQRANVPNHGNGCGVCGNAGFVSNFRAELVAWAAQENAAVSASHVKTSAQTIVKANISTTNSVTLSWNLDSQVTPAQVDLAGATVRVTVRLLDDLTYRFSDLRIVAGSRAIRVKKASFIIDEVLNLTTTTYHGVDAIVNANENRQLSSTPALISIPAPTGGNHTIRLDFEVLQSN